ncbi:helix-turn-helix domain-containing protein [Nevskia sp.]|uniref:helix-turn-helix domain-containing protein n=1 Tax=Nevskia sp. TaxID=1929292 RepID=UPI003F6EED5D
MHRADITAALKKAGSSQSQIARNLGVTSTAVCSAIAGRSESRKIRRAISNATGIPLADLWPARMPRP